MAVLFGKDISIIQSPIASMESSIKHTSKVKYLVLVFDQEADF